MNSGPASMPTGRRLRVRTVLKFASLAVVLLLGGYALLPPAGGDGSAEDAAAAVDRSDAKYVIKFSPGSGYLPGTRPGGLGEPLKGLTTVIARFERRFPDTHIEVVNVPVVVREYLVTQLSGGAAPDIVNVNVENVWVDVQKDWYVPLDGFLERPNPFVVEMNEQRKRENPDAEDLPGVRQWWDMFRYQAITRGKAAPDGKNYCLSLDMVETGIFYNKTLFEKLGLTPPETWEQFLEILERVRQEGKIPLLMDLWSFNDWCQDLIFDQLYYGLLDGIDLKKDPKREAYLQGYLDSEELIFLQRKGFFTRRDPRAVHLWKIMRQLKRYTNKTLSGMDLTREFVTQRAAMYWQSSMLTHRLVSDRSLGFEWGVFYLPRFTRKTTPYASGKPMCVIGGAASQFEVTNAAVADTPPSLPMSERMKRSKRLKRVIAFLQFLCVPENTRTLVNEYPCFLPNIVGVEPLPALKPFEKILERRYTTTKWIFSFDLRFRYVQERMLALYLGDGIDLDEFFDWHEKNLTYATESLARRKKMDFSALAAEWKRLAPKRAGMAGLPPGAREAPP